jgi:hypothetical protein
MPDVANILYSPWQIFKYIIFTLFLHYTIGKKICTCTSTCFHTDNHTHTHITMLCEDLDSVLYL